MMKKLADLFLSVLMILSLSAPAWSQVGDTDGDGVMDEIDNCAQVANTSQTDTDADDLGNACDSDDDEDDIPDAQDAYPLDSSR